MSLGEVLQSMKNLVTNYIHSINTDSPCSIKDLYLKMKEIIAMHIQGPEAFGPECEGSFLQTLGDTVLKLVKTSMNTEQKQELGKVLAHQVLQSYGDENLQKISDGIIKDLLKKPSVTNKVTSAHTSSSASTVNGKTPSSTADKTMQTPNHPTSLAAGSSLSSPHHSLNQMEGRKSSEDQTPNNPSSLGAGSSHGSPHHSLNQMEGSENQVPNVFLSGMDPFLLDPNDKTVQDIMDTILSTTEISCCESLMTPTSSSAADKTVKTPNNPTSLGVGTSHGSPHHSLNQMEERKSSEDQNSECLLANLPSSPGAVLSLNTDSTPAKEPRRSKRSTKVTELFQAGFS